MTSIPSYVLLIHLHSPKLGQLHKAQTILLSFVRIVLHVYDFVCFSTFVKWPYLRTVYPGNKREVKKGLQMGAVMLSVCNMDAHSINMSFQHSIAQTHLQLVPDTCVKTTVKSCINS